MRCIYLRSLTNTFLSVTCSAALLLGSCGPKKQAPERKLYQPEFGWTITLPPGFDSVPAKEWARLQDRGAQAMGDTYNTTVEGRPRSLFVFRSDRFNLFEANAQPFETVDSLSYEETFQGVSNILFETLQTQMPSATLDSSYGEETIGGLKFLRFRTHIKAPELNMQLLMYCRRFDDEELTVNITCTDPQKLKTLLKAWRGSTFSKKEGGNPAAGRD